METYNVGPDEYGIPSVDGMKWAVAWYEENGYEGSGLVVGLQSDGKIRYDSLAHCSCYGGGEAFYSGGNVVEVEEFVSSIDFDPNFPGRNRVIGDFDYEIRKAVGDKVIELLKESLG